MRGLEGGSRREFSQPGRMARLHLPGLPTPPPCVLPQAVLGTLGVRAEATTTNHIMEVQQYLGIGE